MCCTNSGINRVWKFPLTIMPTLPIMNLLPPRQYETERGLPAVRNSSIQEKADGKRMNQDIELRANSIDEIHYKIMEIIRDFPLGKALDFPSGFGRLSYWLKEKGFEVTSCDIAVDEYEKSPIEHIFADLNKAIPFEDNLFDYAFCIDGPEHSENLYHTFREFFRVLKPSGIFITSIPNFSNIESRFKHFFYGIVEPVTTREQFHNSKYGTGCFHINRPPYALLKWPSNQLDSR